MKRYYILGLGLAAALAVLGSDLGDRPKTPLGPCIDAKIMIYNPRTDSMVSPGELKSPKDTLEFGCAELIPYEPGSNPRLDERLGFYFRTAQSN